MKTDGQVTPVSALSSPVLALVLAVDTCGPTGSIALADLSGPAVALVGEIPLAGGEYTATLLPRIAELLSQAGIVTAQLSAIVAVAGPGSFTGIRVGLATVKGLAQAADVPVIAVSRLELLAEAASASCSVLDAHRGQFYCGMYAEGAEVREREVRERLLTAGEINAMGGLAGRVAVCEETVAQLLDELCGEPELMRVPAPTAADALRFVWKRRQSVPFADLAALDGHYLRGADAKLSAGGIASRLNANPASEAPGTR